MMRSGQRRSVLGWGIGGVIVLLALATAEWNRLSLSLGLVTPERRPELLSDARWHAPTSAVKFARRFGPRASVRELVSWLTENQFQIDSPAEDARRVVKSLPCNEDIEVAWHADPQGLLGSATAEVSEAGCQ